MADIKETLLQWFLKGFSAIVVLISAIAGLALVIGEYSFIGPFSNQMIIALFVVQMVVMLLFIKLINTTIERNNKKEVKDE